MIYILLINSPVTISTDPYLAIAVLCGFAGFAAGYYIRKRRERCL